MFEQKLILNNLDDIKRIVEIAKSMDYDIELISDKFTVDAKSITSVFTLDFTKPITIRAHCENNGNLIKQIYPYVSKQGKK